jgi:glycosyltransferase involved in cell wall biosynthesis
LNIWCISKYASTPNYGTAARLFFLAKEFRKLGHETVLITSDSNHFVQFPESKDTYNFENIDSVPVYWIKTKKYTKTASADRILSWFDFERKLFSFPKDKLEYPDAIVVSSLSILSIIYGYYLKKKYKSFLVFEIRDIWPLTMTEEGGFSKWHPLVLFLGWVEKFGYKKADLIVGTMPKLNLHVKDILGYEKPFFCSPLGFNAESYKEPIDKEVNPFTHIFPKNKIIIGYAGSMGITNALEAFIKAIELLKNNTDIHFMLVGGGDLKSHFEKQLIHCDNVTFLPKIKQAQVKHFLDKCDILYLSTQDSKVWAYGQSMNKVVEYMLSTKPIVASYTGYPSMINEAGCGYFIQTNNAKEVKNILLKVTNLSSEERKQMGQNGKKWIYAHRQYSLLAKQYIDEIVRLKDNG